MSNRVGKPNTLYKSIDMKSISKVFGLLGLVALGLTTAFTSQLTAGDQLTISAAGIDGGKYDLQSQEAAGKRVVIKVVRKEIIIEE